MKIHLVAIAAALTLAACGGESNNGESNNGESNNGESNNGGTNNTGTNSANGGTNNPPNNADNSSSNNANNVSAGGAGRLFVAGWTWVTIDIETGTATEFEDAAIAPKPTSDGERWDVSPDGAQIVYAAAGEEATLWIGPSDFSARIEPLITGDGQDLQFVEAPRFSSDGSEVYFIASGSVWSVAADGSADQMATELSSITHAESGNFKPFVAKWNPGSTHILSQNGCASSGCSPTHVGVLDVSTGMVTTISGGGDNEISLAQQMNEPNCNAGSCNKQALNGGKNADSRFGWLNDKVAVYSSTRDQWNTWDGMAVPHGEEAFLTYDIDAPVDFADQESADFETLPVYTSRDGSYYATFVPGSFAVRVYDSEGELVMEHSDTFNAARPAKSMRFAP